MLLEVSLSVNELTGTMPFTTLNQTNVLSQLLLDKNRLTGTIPNTLHYALTLPFSSSFNEYPNKIHTV
jgi:hypothetical protein